MSYRVQKLTNAVNNLSLKADTATYASLLRQCRDCKALFEGKQVHIHLEKNGYLGDTYIANLLIEMYGACHRIDLASSVFDNMRYKNVYTWNIMFGTYAQTGQLQRAKLFFDSMPERDSVSWGALLEMYKRYASLQETLHFFEKIPHPNVVAWTTLVSVLLKNGHLQEARRVFDGLEEPNNVTWNVMIQAYAERGMLEQANDLMNQMPSTDAVTWNVLITANAYYGDLTTARSMFDSMSYRSTVSWNAMIQGYGVHNQMQAAQELFDEMPRRNVISWTSMIAAYAKNGYLQDSRSMFDLMPDRDLASWNAILGAYSDSGSLKHAKDIFVNAPERNVVSWTALLKAYAFSGEEQLALQLPAIMDQEGVKPDEVTYITVVDICSSLPSLAKGRVLHSEISDDGLENHFMVATSLINMYGECGKAGDARALFNRLSVRNCGAWTSMMLAYARNQRGTEALELFLAMQLDGTNPDHITFITLLFACSHAGLMNDARGIFLRLTQDYGLKPSLDHFECMIDMLARAGQTAEAMELINTMPFEGNEWVWTTMLIHRDPSFDAGILKLKGHHSKKFFSDDVVRLIV